MYCTSCQHSILADEALFLPTCGHTFHAECATLLIRHACGCAECKDNKRLVVVATANVNKELFLRESGQQEPIWFQTQAKMRKMLLSQPRQVLTASERKRRAVDKMGLRSLDTVAPMFDPPLPSEKLVVSPGVWVTATPLDDRPVRIADLLNLLLHSPSTKKDS